MKAIITYVTEDGREFNSKYEAKKHECELTTHTWDYYNENMGLQKQQDENSKVAFCKKCNMQKMLR